MLKIKDIAELIRGLFVKVSLACRCKSSCQVGSEKDTKPVEETTNTTVL